MDECIGVLLRTVSSWATVALSQSVTLFDLASVMAWSLKFDEVINMAWVAPQDAFAATTC